jgi:hypothetical protein
MGWLSSLAKIGLVGAAPFTGGATLAALPAVDAIGNVLGKQQQGQAQGQVSQAQLNQGQDRNAVDLYQAQQNAQNQAANTDLQRQQFGTTNRSTTAKQALIGALLGGKVAPTSIANGKASGGLFQALQANPDALAAMKTLGTQGSTAQNTPLTFQGGNIVAPPTLTPLPEESKTNSVLDTISRIAQIAGAVGGAIPQKAPVIEPPDLPVTSGWAGSGFGGG